MKKDNGQILLALLAGAGAGIVAGMLLTPDSGTDFRKKMKRRAMKWNDEMSHTFAKLKAQMQQNNAGNEEHVLHGSWDEVKEQLKEITEEESKKS